MNPTPKELAAMVETMTPGEWQYQDGCSFRRIGTLLGKDGCVARAERLHDGVFSIVITDKDARGIVALRNHFAALMERYERMRTALQFLIDGCPCMPVFNEECRCRKAARALADADKPLESRT